MRQDDIEKILQQYGADRRQQQQAADSLHGLARRQKRRALMVCSAVLLVTTVWTVYQFALPQQAESVIVAQQESPTTVPQPIIQETTPHNAYPVSNLYKKRPASIPSTPLSLPEPEQEEENATYEISEPSAFATTLQSDDADTLHTDTPAHVEPLQPFVQPFEDETLLLADNTAIQPYDDTDKRFRFTASIGASALPKVSNGTSITTDINGQNGLNPSSGSYTSMSPSSTLAANFGVNYSIPLGERQGLELGVGLSGYSHQTEITTYQLRPSDGIDGDNTVSVHPVGDPETYSTFSLYASLPLTFNFKPKGANMGWNMSITPSHSLLTPRLVGYITNKRQILNPWRLTMGVGVALPRGIVRRISFTANLLSLYTSSSLHEIGIEIGF